MDKSFWAGGSPSGGFALRSCGDGDAPPPHSGSGGATGHLDQVATPPGGKTRSISQSNSARSIKNRDVTGGSQCKHRHWPVTVSHGSNLLQSAQGSGSSASTSRSRSSRTSTHSSPGGGMPLPSGCSDPAAGEGVGLVAGQGTMTGASLVRVGTRTVLM